MTEEPSLILSVLNEILRKDGEFMMDEYAEKMENTQKRWRSEFMR